MLAVVLLFGTQEICGTCSRRMECSKGL